MIIPHVCMVKHDPPNSYGDCVRANIASLLGIDNIEDVPHFFHDGCDGPEGHKRLIEWSRKRELMPFYTYYDRGCALELVLEITCAANSDAYQILFGADHCIIIQGGKIIHDPAWYRTRLTRPVDENPWVLLTFVPVMLCK